MITGCLRGFVFVANWPSCLDDNWLFMWLCVCS